MSKDLIQINYREESVGIRTIKTKYIAEITHRGLNDYKIISSDDSGVLRNKVKAHVAKLEEKWDKIVQKENIVRSKEELQKESEILTKEAIKALKEIDEILLFTLEIDDTINWEQLKDKTKFSTQSPEKELNKLLSAVPKPSEPSSFELPKKPEIINFQPKFSLWDNIFKSKKEAKIEQGNNLFEQAIKDWEVKCRQTNEDNQNLKNEFQKEVSNYEKQIEKIKQKNIEDIKKWEKEKAEFISNQEKTNAKVDSMKEMETVK